MITAKQIYQPFFTGLLLFALGCQGQTGQQVVPMDSLNRLKNASSPYLQQHASNPVDWYEWGEEALAKARKENKPLIISIGYSACHWCHVMEHESYMDTTVARIMNDHFVSIKIDREERPDIDQIYMEAAQLMTGRGGWPLNAFALPDGRPFFAGTYFPKAQWIDLLQQVQKAYKNQHEKLLEQAAAVTQGLQTANVIAVDPEKQPFTKAAYVDIFKQWQPLLDRQLGGMKGAPKFPMPVGWEFLLQYHYITQDQEALEAVTTTLDQMAYGGIYDQIGGGFARYATDEYWKVPHFEKMLYDNAQLVSLYAHAYQLTKNPLYADIIRETLDFVEREMTDPQGGFYASLNADSEGEEGKFYVWTQAEIAALLDEKTARLIKDYYQVSQGGNWEEGKNILHRKVSKTAFAGAHTLSVQAFETLLSQSQKKLLQARSKRVRPSTDDKVLTAWNALMLKAYVDAYRALGEEDYLSKALKNANFLEQNMLRSAGSVWRNYKDGKASIEAFLDDYALLAEAFVELYQVTFDVEWLTKARALTDYTLTHFYDKQSHLFFYTSDQSETLIARKKEVADNVIPSSNSVMAKNLYQMGVYFDHQPYIDTAAALLAVANASLSQGGPYAGNWMQLTGWFVSEPYEVAIMGQDALQKNRKLQAHYLPTSFFMGGKKENLPLLSMKLIPGETIIYVCQKKICKLPVTEVQKALGQIE